MRTAEWILSTYKTRKADAGPQRARAQEISSVYDGVVQVPLPELDENENAAVANLLRLGLDQTAMRIASVSPNVICPPLVPGQKKSEDNARIRRLAIGSWWEQNRWDRKLRKRARWLIGYAGSPVVIRPDRRKGIPCWELRDPSCYYPAPMPEADDILPEDAIFALKRSYQWIRNMNPTAAIALDPSTNPDLDQQFEILEFIDADECVMVAVGKPPGPAPQRWGMNRQEVPQGAPFVELNRYPNLVGRCTVVGPTRLSLNKPSGQFDQMPGLYKMQARMMALSVIATERAIFPDVWFVSRPNEVVTVLQRPDGRAGVPGEVKGGDLKEMATQMPPMVMQMIQEMERNMRVTAGVSQDYGGENPTNTRTARAGEQLLKATVDYWVQEAQETLGMSYTEENRLAICTAKAYFGNTSRSFYVSKAFKGAKGPVDYTPNVNFDSDLNDVAWPFSGSDANALEVRIGQKLGLQTMSKRTAMEIDPDIDDPDRETDRIDSESLKNALLASIDQAVAQGQLGPLEVGRITELVATGKMELWEAVNKVHDETQQMQQGPSMGGQPPNEMGQPPPAGGAGPGGPPGQAPGIMAPALQQQLGVGPNNLPGQGPPMPAPGVAHMSQLLKMLHGGGGAPNAA